jgi:hypothetical protein
MTSITYYTKAIAMNLLARKRCEETIGPNRFDPEPSQPTDSPTVPLRIFRMNFHKRIQV